MRRNCEQCCASHVCFACRPSSAMVDGLPALARLPVSSNASFHWLCHPCCCLFSIEGEESQCSHLSHNSHPLPSSRSSLSSRGCAPRCVAGEHAALRMLIANPA